MGYGSKLVREPLAGFEWPGSVHRTGWLGNHTAPAVISIRRECRKMMVVTRTSFGHDRI
jgi:hypothetical protein